MSAVSRPMPWWPANAGVLDFLEFLDADSSWGWPDVDIRARYRFALGDPSGHDPTLVLARLYVEITADTVVHPGALSLGREIRDKDGQIMWSEAYYAASKLVYPDQDCPECWHRGPFKPGYGHSIVNGLRHHAPSWPLDHPDRCSLAQRRDCWHGAPTEVRFDHHGCLTSCCAAAWTIDDVEWCKCCGRRPDEYADRHLIYQMWEAPPLSHYVERIRKELA